MAEDVLEHDHGVVHNSADGKHEATHRDDVEGHARKVHECERGEDGEGDGDGDDEGAPESGEEEEDDDDGEASALDGHVVEVIEGVAYELGLVGGRCERDAFGELVGKFPDRLADGIGDLDGVGSRFFDD